MGTNLLVSCDGNFENIIVRNVLDFIPLRGCSDMDFVPNTGDTEIICCRTVEDDDAGVESYISIFNLKGDVLLNETLFEKDLKYEGIISVI